MDIAALSMSMAQVHVQQQAALSVTKMAMETAEVQMQELTEMIQASGVSPALSGADASLGQFIDVRV